MSERGKAKYAYISAGSNTTVKDGPGTLYRVLNSIAGSINLVEDGDLGTTLNMNALGGSDTIARAYGNLDFGPGVGFNNQLTIAAGSNAKVTVVYE